MELFFISKYILKETNWLQCQFHHFSAYFIDCSSISVHGKAWYGMVKVFFPTYKRIG